jgi:hypothetical protein
MKKMILLMILFSWSACKNEKEASKTDVQKSSSYENKTVGKSRDSVFSDDIQYINDSVLKGKFRLDISRYASESMQEKCPPNAIKKDFFYEEPIEGNINFIKDFKNLGDLNGDGKNDSVFILPALNMCEEGQSYYFTDNNIPRIESDSYCCHTESIFSIGDIDEDGGNEIAEYNSSCSSNYKAIRIWTLKNNQWKSVGIFTFYYNNGKYKAFEDFDKLYKKISKNKFKFLEISDQKADGSLVMEWHTVEMAP